GGAQRRRSPGQGGTATADSRPPKRKWSAAPTRQYRLARAGQEGAMMNHMKKMLLILPVVVGLGMAAEKSAEVVKAAEKSWASATVADDEATLKQVLSDDLTYTHSTGETDTKQA